MLKIIFVIAISFFAVLGVIECICCAIETFSISKYSTNINKIELRFHLKGKIDDVSFLLNTFLLQADRFIYKNNVPSVKIIDDGLDENTYLEINDFCQINNNISIENWNIIW